MNTVPIKYTVYGFEMSQVQRRGDLAIYAQARPGCQPIAWEVVRIRRASAQVILGHEYPEREVLPGAADWGSDGWTCLSLEAAEARLRSE